MLDGINGTLNDLTMASEVDYVFLVSTLEQSSKQVRVDLPLKVLDGPRAALRLDLVEAAFGLVLDIHEQAIVEPTERR